MASTKKQPRKKQNLDLPRSKKTPSSTAGAETASPTPESLHPSAPSRGLMLVAVLMAVIALGVSGGALYMQVSGADNTAEITSLKARISNLDTEITALKKADASTDYATTEGLNTLARRLDETLDQLNRKIETLAAQPAATPKESLAEAPDLSPLVARLDNLEGMVSQLTTSLAAMQQAKQAETPPEPEDDQTGWGAFFGDLFRITKIDEGTE